MLVVPSSSQCPDTRQAQRSPKIRSPAREPLQPLSLAWPQDQRLRSRPLSTDVGIGLRYKPAETAQMQYMQCSSLSAVLATGYAHLPRPRIQCPRLRLQPHCFRAYLVRRFGHSMWHVQVLCQQ